MPDRTLLRATTVDPQDDSVTSPQSYLAVRLDDPERSKFEAWVKNHLQQIEQAMSEVQARFEEEVNQFEGLMPGGDYPYPGAFRVNVPVTKKKVREVANRLKQAYLDSDPIWAVDSAELPAELVAAIERGLDHQVDHELSLEDDMAQAIFDAVWHGVGALEPCWAYSEDIVRDLEVYRGYDGQTFESLADLVKFEERYPDWKDNKIALGLHSKLARGEQVAAEVEYRAPTTNRPDLVHIPCKDLRIYPSLNSWQDLQSSPCYGYVKTHNRMELEAFEADGTIDADQLKRVWPKKLDSEETSAQDEMDDADVFRATVRYQMPGDSEPRRYAIWYERESCTVLRIRKFPWWLALPNLILHHIRQEEPGVFKRGLAWDLKDTHVACNVTLSLYLNGADMANSMRWYAKQGSVGEQHILQRRWSPHLPMPWKTDPNEVQSLQTSTSHLGPLVQGFELMRRQSDEETQTSSLQSGRESPTDPSAPATKTIALLQQVEPNTKELLRSLQEGFRQSGRWILGMFYQAKRLGWITEIPGFPDIPDELLLEVGKKLQPRSILFEFDRATRLQADQMVMNLVAAYAPQAVPQVLRKVISHTSSDWAREADSLPLETPVTPPEAPTAPTPTAGQPSSGGGRLAGLAPSNGKPPSAARELVGSIR